MEQWLAFAQDRWYLLVGALVVLLLVVRVVKTVVKWVIIAALLVVLAIYGANYKDQLKSIGASVGQKVASEVSDQALKALKDEAKDAKFRTNADGTFTITSKSLQVAGKPGSDDVTVTFMGQTFHLSGSDTVKAFIEQAKANSK
ncbi:hypothetical protein SD70_00325 [Gordoniibacillus kamchatkensis]|uniref:Uncharacterized protein n=1 Tax=Gordoniibacillus kamchatkensis TaxID=1590651 RepID=A0ABR5AN62_9BACL|nr:hypothetical protein [Paenibacillus sp. VKM B-2647]KIL42411.1 hypothetical protein SD70_00325 [Paenibacillus sp. VKM B-2647]